MPAYLLPLSIFIASGPAHFYFTWRLVQILKARHPAVYKGIYRFGHTSRVGCSCSAGATNRSTIRNFPNVHRVSG